MKRVFSHLPIRLKLIAMIMTTCAAAVVLASLGYLVIDYYQTRERARARSPRPGRSDPAEQPRRARVRRRRRRQGNPQHARVEAEHPVACLYQRDAHLFAGYRQQGETGACPPLALPEGTRFGSESVQLARDGTNDGKRFGSVLLRSDLAALARRGRAQLADRRGAAGARARCRRAAVVAPAGDRVRPAHRARQHRRRGDPPRRLLAAGDADRPTTSWAIWSTLQPHARANRERGKPSSPGPTRSCGAKWRSGAAPNRNAPSCWCASAKPTG